MDGYSSLSHFEKSLLSSMIPTVFFPRKRVSIINLACHSTNILLTRRGLSAFVSLDELAIYYKSLWENRICTAQGAFSCYSVYQSQSRVPGSAAAQLESHPTQQTCSLNRITDLISPLARLPLPGNLTNSLRAQLAI